MWLEASVIAIGTGCMQRYLLFFTLLTVLLIFVYVAVLVLPADWIT